MNSNIKGIIKLTGRIIRETDKAILFRFSIPSEEGGDSEMHSEWFPLSQVDRIKHSTTDADGDELVVARWLLQKKELLA